jgi:hypothetical protein
MHSVELFVARKEVGGGARAQIERHWEYKAEAEAEVNSLKGGTEGRIKRKK